MLGTLVHRTNIACVDTTREGSSPFPDVMLLATSPLGLLSAPHLLRYRTGPAIFRSLRMGSLPAPESQTLKISQYWEDRLHELTKPAACNLITQLSDTNSLCFENMHKTSGSLVEFAVQEKEKRPDVLLLIRVGEFYEAFGLDALMLVQHAGLNPMGRKCRAGCPASNIQATLDDLTAAGLSVAVYEEVAPANTAGGKFRKLKQRALSQIVTPASPTYIYEACLSHDDIDYAEPPPCVGIAATASGFTLVSVSVDSRCYKVFPRLSLPALRALLAARPHAPPLLVADQFVSRGGADASVPMPSLPTENLLGAGLLERRTLRTSSPADFPRAVVAYAADQAQAAASGFRRIASRRGGADAPPRPLYHSTASQIGLIPTPGIPDLARSLLPPTAPAACVSLLRRWLLLPPRPSIADSMHVVCQELIQMREPLPSCRPVPVGKLVGLVLAKQGNAPFFREMKIVLDAMSMALSAEHLDKFNEALLRIVGEESGFHIGAELLQADARKALGKIADVVADHRAGDDAGEASGGDRVTGDSEYELVPLKFFRHNEEPFRSLVRPERAASHYEEVRDAKVALCEAVRAAVAPGMEHSLVHDAVNNAIYIKRVEQRNKAKPKSAGGTADDGGGAARGGGGEQESGKLPPQLEEARDRNRRLLPNRYTTESVREAVGRYRSACESATAAVRMELQALSEGLQPMLPTLVAAAHWSLFSSTLVGHVGHAMQQEWALPRLRDPSDPSRAMVVQDLWPYWLSREAAGCNSFTWDAIWLLTAPNMAGKSSLMRSMTVAALLSNAGLMAPLDGGLMPRYDSYFLRTASFDVPSEGKSAFAQEVDDLQVMTAESTPRSLVLLDEIGRGTSPKEGAALSTALIEWLDERGMTCVFATHLHEIEQHLAGRDAEAPPKPPLARLERKCLRVLEPRDGGGELRMTYELADGVCSHSYALSVAQNAGLPSTLVSRAQELLHLGQAERQSQEDAATSASGERPSLDTSTHTTGGERIRGEEDELFELAANVLREASGADSSNLLRLDSGWQPPPSLHGKPCVYLLRLQSCARDADAATTSGRLAAAFYVGESDSIVRRLREHRKRHGDANVDCVLVPVSSKSEALRVETQTIQRLKVELGGAAHVRNVANA
jgi:hypothetical protein